MQLQEVNKKSKEIGEMFNIFKNQVAQSHGIGAARNPVNMMARPGKLNGMIQMPFFPQDDSFR